MFFFMLEIGDYLNEVFKRKQKQVCKSQMHYVIQLNTLSRETAKFGYNKYTKRQLKASKMRARTAA